MRGLLMVAMAIGAALPVRAAESGAGEPAATADFAEVRHILTDRCLFCHTGVAQEDGLNPTFQAPKGITFDTPAQIVRFAPGIMTYAVLAKSMPPSNSTGMTEDERRAVGAWIAAGAKVP